MKTTMFQLRKRIESSTMFLLCTVFAGAIVATLGLVVWFLGTKGVASLSADFFLKGPELNARGVLAGGMRNAIEGTLILLGLASVVGIPVGIMAGVYLSEYEAEGWLAKPTRFVADVLTGVPSIVVGIVGYELVVVPMGHFSGWAGVAALSFIMIPIVARTSEEMLKLVPRSYREGSLALGATKAQTIVRVVVPSAAGSMVTGVMLAIARIAGETAPLLFTAMGTALATRNPSEPFPSLTLAIFNYAKSPSPEQQSLAWTGILVLIMILLILNVATRWLAARTVRMRGT